MFKVFSLKTERLKYKKKNLTLRERVFENRALRIIFGPEKEEMVGGWGRLHNEKFHNLYTHQMLLG
jgi:hypothetical protein